MIEALEGLEVPGDSLLHGDLIPGNVLIDERSDPTALLDFGFLTTVGDPAFDAAVVTSIFDMYGAHARSHERILEDAVVDRFGHSPERLDLYRAAYALVTSNCFSTSGGDGHFAWCAGILKRGRVRDVLLSSAT